MTSLKYIHEEVSNNLLLCWPCLIPTKAKILCLNSL
jgi:hypothetical protein